MKKKLQKSISVAEVNALSQGLAPLVPCLKAPKPFKWGKDFTSDEIIEAIREERK